ncbi:MAG: ABC transporter permease subunit [Clostridia bacterium]|nr:ABC transporter permease subunit [Clostridia bacterium]
MRRALNILYKLLPHALFLALMGMMGVIMQRGDRDWAALRPMLALAVLMEAIVLLRAKRWETAGIFSILFGVLILWQAYASFMNTSVSFLFPPPDKVVAVLVKDIRLILHSILASFWLLLLGFALAVVLGVALALLCGYNRRLQNLVVPIADVFSAIPALVYAPYAVAVFPSFWLAALFVIASGLFWPILINTIQSINSIDRTLLDSARALDLNRRDMILRILLPYCTPGLFNTFTMQISSAVMLLIGAELMGMTSGVGWYVKYNSDFSNYTKVIAGFIVIGVLVSLVNAGLDLLKRRLLMWTNMEGRA